MVYELCGLFNAKSCSYIILQLANEYFIRNPCLSFLIKYAHNKIYCLNTHTRTYTFSLSLSLYIYIYIYINPSARAGCDTGLIFKRGLTNLNSFSFPRPVAIYSPSGKLCDIRAGWGIKSKIQSRQATFGWAKNQWQA